MIPMNPSLARGWVHIHSSILVELCRLVDAAWIFLGLWLAKQQAQIMWQDPDLLTGLVALALFTGIAGQLPLYRSWRVSTLGAELRRNAECWLFASVALTVLAFLFDEHAALPRQVLVMWVPATLALMLSFRAALRMTLRGLRKSGANFRLAAIVGANDTGLAVRDQIVRSEWTGFKFVGLFDDRDPQQGRVEPTLAIDGGQADLVRLARSGQLDCVFIALPLRAEFRIRALIDDLRDSTVTVMYVPNFHAFGLLSARLEVFQGLPIVNVIDSPHLGSQGLSKRVFDFVVALMFLVVLCIPMLAIALAIRLTSAGPALFRQRRYGLDGREIWIYKFRTMRVEEDGKSSFTQATRGDVRITALGAFLRRTSLDELPQFLNVLQGRMSIVGPRPHPVALNESHRRKIEGYMLRHKVRPGITGWAQVHGCRGETDTAEKMLNRVHYDLEYINQWSFSMDLRILWMTMFSVFNDPNAY